MAPKYEPELYLVHKYGEYIETTPAIQRLVGDQSHGVYRDERSISIHINYFTRQWKETYDRLAAVIPKWKQTYESEDIIVHIPIRYASVLGVERGEPRRAPISKRIMRSVNDSQVMRSLRRLGL